MMTMFQRFWRSLQLGSGLNSNFEHYYSSLLYTSDPESGVPSAREAQRDRDAALTKIVYYPQL